MMFRVELRFVDESEFQKQGKWHILSENPEWEIDLTISCEFNRSLDEEYDSEEVFDLDSDSLILTSSDGSDSDLYREEASMFAGDTRGAKSTEEEKRKRNSGGHETEEKHTSHSR